MYVLQSNSARPVAEIFGGYKKRWQIETLYQYLKNAVKKLDNNAISVKTYMIVSKWPGALCPKFTVIHAITEKMVREYTVNISLSIKK